MIAILLHRIGLCLSGLVDRLRKSENGLASLGMFSEAPRSSKNVATLCRFLAHMVKIPGHGVRSTPKVGRACKVGVLILRLGSEKRD